MANQPPNYQPAYGSVLTYIDDFGNVIVEPVTPTPPGGEYYSEEAYAGAEGSDYTQPPIDMQLDALYNNAAIYDVLFEGYALEWVNTQHFGIPGLGPVEQGVRQSGHSAAIIMDPTEEQGWGMDPAIVTPRYPVTQNFNPFRSQYTERRFGNYAFQPNPPSYGATVASGGANYDHVQLQWAKLTRNRHHGVVVEVPPTVPFSAISAQNDYGNTLGNLMPDQHGIGF